MPSKDVCYLLRNSGVDFGVKKVGGYQEITKVFTISRNVHLFNVFIERVLVHIQERNIQSDHVHLD